MVFGFCLFVCLFSLSWFLLVFGVFVCEVVVCYFSVVFFGFVFICEFDYSFSFTV